MYIYGIYYSLYRYDLWFRIFPGIMMMIKRRKPCAGCFPTNVAPSVAALFGNRVQGSFQSTGVQTNIPDRD